MELLFNVIIALVAVIVSLTALIRFYLPYHDRKLHNPWSEKVLEKLTEISSQNAQHHTWEKTVFEELRRDLERIESKLS